MKKTTCAVVLLLAVSAGSFLPITLAHERKEVAGLTVVFGAEPEPALTGELQQLRWRFQSKESGEPYAELKDAKAMVKRNGKEFGPFDARGSRREPGTLQTTHIFTESGEYDVRLSFRKGSDPEVHTVDFTYRIRDRRDLEVPGR